MINVIERGLKRTCANGYIPLQVDILADDRFGVDHEAIFSVRQDIDGRDERRRGGQGGYSAERFTVTDMGGMARR